MTPDHTVEYEPFITSQLAKLSGGPWWRQGRREGGRGGGRTHLVDGFEARAGVERDGDGCHLREWPVPPQRLLLQRLAFRVWGLGFEV